MHVVATMNFKKDTFNGTFTNAPMGNKSTNENDTKKDKLKKVLRFAAHSQKTPNCVELMCRLTFDNHQGIRKIHCSCASQREMGWQKVFLYIQTKHYWQHSQI